MNLADRNEPNNPELQNKREYMYALVLAVYRITDKFPHKEHLRLKMREESVNVLSHLEHIYEGREPDRYKKFINSIQTLVHYCEVAEKQNWVNSTNFAVLKHELFKLRNSIEMPEQVEEIPHVHEASYEVDLRKNRGADSSLNKEEPAPLETARARSEDPSLTGSKNSSALYARGSNPRRPEPPPRHPEPSEGSRGSGERRDQADATLASSDRSYRTNKTNRSNMSDRSYETNKTDRSSAPSLSTRQERIIDHLRRNGTVQAADLSNIIENVSPRTIRRDLDKLIKHGKIAKEGKTNGARYYLA